MGDTLSSPLDAELLRGLTVLCVEDEVEAREHLAALLRRRVREVLTAENGAAGLVLFQERRPDLVITDIQMPAMDGLTMASAMKRIRGAVPIIVTSAFGEQEYLRRAMEPGLDGYVIKPIDTRQLIAEMSKAARMRAQTRTPDGI